MDTNQAKQYVAKRLQELSTLDKIQAVNTTIKELFQEEFVVTVPSMMRGGLQTPVKGVSVDSDGVIIYHLF